MRNKNAQDKADRKQGPVQLEHIEAIEKSLWNTADTLRSNSNYASNEYFMPVMGLIFLQHAFSRYLAVKDVPPRLLGLPHGAVAVLRGAYLTRRERL